MANVVEPQDRAAGDPVLDSEGLDRGVGFLGLLWSSEGSIIGSGWLLGALGAAVIAGPSSIIGWIVASLIVILLALVHAELGGIFPDSGATSRFPHSAFGRFADQRPLAMTDFHRPDRRLPNRPFRGLRPADDRQGFL